MAVNQIPNTFRTKFIDEFQMDWDREQSWLAQTTHKYGIVGAETVKFDVVDPADEAQEKTRDGKVPTSQMGLSQVPATLRKIHKKYKVDNFDAFMANPNLRTAMNKKGTASINKGIDGKIVTTLDGTTVELSGSAVDFSLKATFLGWTSKLWDNDVPNDGNVWGVITPRAFNQMLRITEFASKDYQSMTTWETGLPMPMKFKEWLGVKWLPFNGLTGVLGATAKCYLYHTNAIGHMLSGEPEGHPFANDEDDYTGVRYDAMDAAAITLPRGVCRAFHNDTAAFS